MSSQKRKSDETGPSPPKVAKQPDDDRNAFWSELLATHASTPRRIVEFLQWCHDGFDDASITICGSLEQLEENAQNLWHCIHKFFSDTGFWAVCGVNPSRAPHAQINGDQQRRVLFDTYSIRTCSGIICSKTNCTYCLDAGKHRTDGLGVYNDKPRAFHAANTLKKLAQTIHTFKYRCHQTGTMLAGHFASFAENTTIDQAVQMLYKGLVDFNVLDQLAKITHTYLAQILLTRVCLGGLTVHLDDVNGTYPTISNDTFLNTELDHVIGTKIRNVVIVFGSNGLLAGHKELIKTVARGKTDHQRLTKSSDHVIHSELIYKDLQSRADFMSLSTISERFAYFTQWNVAGALPWPCDMESDIHPSIRGIKFYLAHLGVVKSANYRTGRVSELNNRRVFQVMHMIFGGGCVIPGCSSPLDSIECNHVVDKRNPSCMPEFAKLRNVSELVQLGYVITAFNERLKTEPLCRPHHFAWTGRNLYASPEFADMIQRARAMVSTLFPDRLHLLPTAWTPEHVPFLDVCFRDEHQVRIETLKRNGIYSEPDAIPALPSTQ